MTKEQFTSLLRNPSTINLTMVKGLEEITERFPYFQNAHLLLAKQYQGHQNIRYESYLRKAAAYAPDRRVLYELIHLEPQEVIHMVKTEQEEVEVITSAKSTTPETETKIIISESAVEKSVTADEVLHNIEITREVSIENIPGNIPNVEKADAVREIEKSEESLSSPEIIAEEEIETSTIHPAIHSEIEKHVESESIPVSYSEDELIIEKESSTPIKQEEITASAPEQLNTIPEREKENLAQNTNGIQAREIQQPIAESAQEIIAKRLRELEAEKTKVESEPESVSDFISPVIEAASANEIAESKEIRNSIIEEESELHETDEIKSAIVQKFNDTTDIENEVTDEAEDTTEIAEDEPEFVRIRKEAREPREPRDPKLLVVEQHTFLDWLKMKDIPVIPTDRVSEYFNKELNDAENANPGNDLITRFIKTEPRIVPARSEFYSPGNMARQSAVDHEHLISETLARIYAQQGNIPKAIDAYKRLSLKNPEKSSYFAALIKDLEEKSDS